MKNKILILSVLVLLSTACEDLFDPAIENKRGLDAMYQEPGYAQGILANGYILLPYSSTPNSDVATDDAVSNDNSNDYREIASGSWSASNNPASQWQGRKNAIQYLNLFLENADQVVWSTDSIVNILFNDRLKGEAYGLRAIQMYYLLLAHGGRTQDGRLLGVPILTESEDIDSDFNYPRNTFQECVDQIFSDANKAIELLPYDFKDISSTSDIPEQYQDMEGVNPTNYSRVNGSHMKGRLTGRIVEAVKAQIALLAASPAYSEGTSMTWEDAANYAAVVLNQIDGVDGMDETGYLWYTKDKIENLGSGENPLEILWRSDIGQNNDLETDNFPPSLYGKGRVNPTQNLVDAFPMANGYPISDPLSNYDPDNPYEGRDPRLSSYIVVNGSTQGPNNSVILTDTYSTNEDNSKNVDGLNKEGGLSTRTGYYLRKLLRPDCNPDSNFDTDQKHYTARIRYTEIFLAYAEAANEAWGPMGTGGHAYSAYDVIKSIRARAGVGESNNDAYLESIRNDQDMMRELIRNERRLELCFENHRFWDLRRWKVSLDKLNETAKGVGIGNSGGTLIYNPIDVDARNYKEYMYHGPIPYNETLKWSELEQNAGW